MIPGLSGFSAEISGVEMATNMLIQAGSLAMAEAAALYMDAPGGRRVWKSMNIAGCTPVAWSGLTTSFTSMMWKTVFFVV
ncbi:Uncharacterised protein [Salmonella enterica subsp. arizonae]|uniref:Uncharacterized protein n=1 Tax=Salmonella enterica subsp. arizonae TaxID=59203 RepID=A0A379XIH9_SALER|nr:Uncharacterised protein [Salmonella enterica subsp. arizonae]